VRNFWTFVEMRPKSECLFWKGSKNPKGYGLLGPQYKPYRRAHRYAWFLSNGQIPKGMFILHVCDNPSCVNIGHLKLGTAKENTQDMMDKGRNNYNAARLKQVGFKKGNPGYGYRRNKNA